MDEFEALLGDTTSSKGWKMPSSKIQSSPRIDLQHLNLLTPPVSEEYAKPVVREKNETPRSHRFYEDSCLPREFKRKCSIFHEGLGTGHLSSIVEESDVDGNRKKLTENLDSLARILNAEDSSEMNKKRVRIDNFCSPMKKVKLSNKLATSIINQEHKENSPIKLDYCRSVIKLPPFKFSQLQSEQDNRFDILTKMAHHNLFNIIEKIIDYLGPFDRLNMEEVSKNWCRLVHNVTSKVELGIVRKLALTSKENLWLSRDKKPCNQEVKSRNETTPKKLVKTKSLNCISPKRRTASSPELSPGTKRFRRFVQEGQALGPNERLEKCPNCKYPAMRQETKAICSKCSYTFCPQCRCPPHPTEACFVLSSTPPSPNTIISRRYTVGSKASKKALRRL